MTVDVSKVIKILSFVLRILTFWKRKTPSDQA